jgi:hypothetical protein
MREVVTAANKTSAWVCRLDLSIAALASQGLPFRGYLAPVVKGRTRL